MSNSDRATEQAFDDKWGASWRGRSNAQHALRMFHASFRLFPFAELRDGEGFDLGCGVGRHARFVAPQVGKLHCIDPSPNAIAGARASMSANMSGSGNVAFHLAGVDDIPLADESQDFGYSMGVLHHIPDTEAGLGKCVDKLKPGAPFLLYLYYSFDNRPWWFRALWKVSDAARRRISRMPFRRKKRITDAIAILVYFPLSRAARLIARTGLGVEAFPLSFYRNTPLVNLKVSSLDRFGTNLERRFSKTEIEAMMRRVGLTEISFQDEAPYWIALGRKAPVGAREQAASPAPPR